MLEVRGGGQEEQPHAQGAVAAWALEGLEELSHFKGQEQRHKMPGCDSIGMAERSYPTSEVRGDGLKEIPCA